jgi:2-oxoglutarate ferredoxin oxidoreductase subunit beta
MEPNKQIIDRYGRSEGPLTYPKQPTWCPGCGNYAIWGAIKKGLVDTGIPMEEIAMVYDVGCSGNMADFNKYYGLHALHGRALPAATGLKLANHKLNVVVIIGDGGGYGEGGTHLLNEMRGNHDITVIVHNNHRYSLTTGQYSPTTDKGTKTKSTPGGSIEEPINALAIAISNHATYVAREFSGDIPRTATRITEAIKHPGFALLEILQPCPVFNPVQDYDWYRARITKLEDESHDSANQAAAWAQSMRSDKLPLGVFYKLETPSYHQQVAALKTSPLVEQFRKNCDITKLINEFK